MQSLKFKQLLVISNQSKSGNRFDFQSDLTIITADDNDYGKSTLGRLLYWTLGCEIDFDSRWKDLDCKTILKFAIGDREYEAMRYKDFICLTQDGATKFYPKITGDYSEAIGNILGFHALMPKRDTTILETPPPGYFFVPYYIDQKKSWAVVWEPFASLQQYKNWKGTIIKYHIGLLTKEHFELELKKSSKKQEISEIDAQVIKLDSTIEVVSQFIFEPAATISRQKLDKMTDEISIDLKKLSEYQEKTLDDLTKLEGEKAFLDSQKSISQKIIAELDKDYKFAVEHFSSDEIECPLCGTNHENSVINRTSILTDKQQAEVQLGHLTLSLEELNVKIEKAKSKLEKTRSDIENIHSKYIVGEDDDQISLNQIIENIAGNSIKDNVLKQKGEKLVETKAIQTTIRSISDEQKGLLTEEQKKETNELFLKTMISYLEALGAENINMSAIQTPLDFNKITKEGGSALGARGLLAYYLTIHTMIESSGNEILAPLLIDTPNQHEQSIANYDMILELIKKKISTKGQIILCALQNEKLDILKGDAKIIHLTSERLLSEAEFEKVKPEFDRYKIEEIMNQLASENDDEVETED